MPPGHLLRSLWLLGKTDVRLVEGGQSVTDSKMAATLYLDEHHRAEDAARGQVAAVAVGDDSGEPSRLARRPAMVPVVEDHSRVPPLAVSWSLPDHRRLD